MVRSGSRHTASGSAKDEPLPDRSFKAVVRVDAVVWKVDRRSARVRILGENGQVTFRSGDVWDVVPGHLVTLAIDRRWTGR